MKDPAKTQPEKLDLRSHDIAEGKRQELLRLFPETRTEGGKIDFDRLKLALGEAVDVGKERYGMTWPGKADCFKTIQMPSLGTLRPCPEESVNFDTSENLIIEGDNLEALKLLQKSYLGKIKMIYIDPPYNTGSDFIYPDNYTESLQTYLEYTGQVDAQGKKFSTNTETDGRFHSKWLNMMYPRLYLARNLLREDGVIFITVDNQEVDNLKKVGHEVFGEENFVSGVVWQKKVSPANDAKWFSSDHDYVIVYARNKDVWRPNGLDRSEAQTAYYKNPDKDPRGDWNSATYTCNKSRSERPNLYYPITNPHTGQEVWPKETAVWKYAKSISDQHQKENRLYWGADGQAQFPRIKLFLAEMDKVVPRSIWGYADVGHTQEATSELRALLGDTGFDTPKPSRLVKRILEITGNEDDETLVLDFFAGSGTTAHAVLDLNKQDGGNRKFILVQLPEPCSPGSAAYKAGFKTIADICKERVRRVIKKLNEEDAQTFQGRRSRESGNPDLFATGGLDSRLRGNDKGNTPDLGFRVFKLAESNFTPWDAEAPQDAVSLAKQLELHIHHVRDGRTELDLLYEILLKSGFPLTTPVEPLTLAGKQVHSVAGGALLICLERELTLELIRAMAEKKPERVVCLDEGFAGNDQLKANAVQIFKTKGVTSFKTV
ncbi:MAG: site-specific DNA-methyltransferase [Nitrospira sp.]|nr:site-specific DNA-methyltransferase [Nitrospira sp.]